MNRVFNKILNLKRRIMARIYVEYTRRAVMEHPDYLMLTLFVVTSLILVFVREISVNDIWNNMPKNNLVSAFNFFVVAIRNTSWAIQILIAGFIARILISGSKLTYKNIKTDWIMTKFRSFRY